MTATKTPALATPSKPRLTIAVLNQKGGVGKTTLAMNLAAAAHLGGERTILLDLDTQGNSFDWSFARTSATSRLDGLVVARADRALSPKRFAELTAGFRVAILDGPARIGDVTHAAAGAADVVLVPLRSGVLNWWACSETLKLLESADGVREQMGLAPARRVFVLNEANERTRLARVALDAMEKLGEVAPAIASRVAFGEAATEGECVLTVAPEGPAAAEIWRLWHALSAGRGS